MKKRKMNSISLKERKERKMMSPQIKNKRDNMIMTRKKKLRIMNLANIITPMLKK